jgi:hypothetical protein
MIMTLLERYKNGETKAVYDDIAKNVLVPKQTLLQLI